MPFLLTWDELNQTVGLVVNLWTVFLVLGIIVFALIIFGFITGRRS